MFLFFSLYRIITDIFHRRGHNSRHGDGAAAGSDSIGHDCGVSVFWMQAYMTANSTTAPPDVSLTFPSFARMPNSSSKSLKSSK